MALQGKVISVCVCVCMHITVCVYNIHCGSHSLAAGSMPCEPLVLLGRLSPDDNSQGDQYSGEIIFSDGTGSIVCEVSRTVLSMIIALCI